MIYNQWYIILESKELKNNKPVRIKRFNEDLALWRNSGGEICCISDHCCHRGASLACGRIVNGGLECPFHGFIWIFWGEADKILGSPFFFKELAKFSYSSFKDNWNVHYSRAIENQLDVVHLPFVHRTTIGRGNKTLVNGPVVTRNGELLTFYVNNVEDDGKTIPMKPDEIEGYENFFSLQFHFPNVWQNLISDKIRAVAAFVPVDEENTIIYIRYYQDLIKVPILRELVLYAGKISSLIILRQDKRVVKTQLPKKSSLRMNEQLVMGDKPIIEYRKHRQYLIEQNPKPEN